MEEEHRRCVWKCKSRRQLQFYLICFPVRRVSANHWRIGSGYARQIVSSLSVVPVQTDLCSMAIKFFLKLKRKSTRWEISSANLTGMSCSVVQQLHQIANLQQVSRFHTHHWMRIVVSSSLKPASEPHVLGCFCVKNWKNLHLEPTA